MSKIGLVEKLTSNQYTIGFTERNLIKDLKFYRRWKKIAKIAGQNNAKEYTFEQWVKDSIVPELLDKKQMPIK